MLPGRTNLFETDGIRYLIDFGHKVPARTDLKPLGVGLGLAGRDGVAGTRRALNPCNERKPPAERNRMKKNVFVIGLNEFNHERLQRLHGAEGIEFHRVIDSAIISEAENFNIPAMLETAERQLNEFDGSIDAIVGYIDFPVSTMLPLLCRKFGVRSVSLEALLKCEHKYWSRVVQREVIPDNIPKFTYFHPFGDDALGRIGSSGLAFPFFVKPIKASGSRLGFRIDSPEDFDHAVAKFRDEIGSIAEPFDYVLEKADLPDEIRAVSGSCCMAEQVIGGRQCTLEGYVHNGVVTCYAMVDSIRYPQVLSFFYYLYPSQLPGKVQQKMQYLAETVMAHIGFDNSAFNIEFFWDEIQDQIWLLEINTRIAQAHCDLFEKVDGLFHRCDCGPRAAARGDRSGRCTGSRHADRIPGQGGHAPVRPTGAGRLQLRRGSYLDGGQQAVLTAVEL